MGKGLNLLGLILMVVGVIAFFGGVGADETETATTCYEGTYSSGCVETEYQNPAAGSGPIVFGIVLSIVGFIFFTSGGPSSKGGISNDLEEELEERQEQR